MITIQELLLREGRWLGGQNPRPKFRIEWNPSTVFIKYPWIGEASIDAFDWAKVSKLANKTNRRLIRIMHRPDPLLQHVPWIPSQGKTHRSSRGPKLYAVRDSEGRFKDIQAYERQHRRDLRRKAK